MEVKNRSNELEAVDRYVNVPPLTFMRLNNDSLEHQAWVIRTGHADIWDSNGGKNTYKALDRLIIGPHEAVVIQNKSKKDDLIIVESEIFALKPEVKSEYDEIFRGKYFIEYGVQESPSIQKIDGVPHGPVLLSEEDGAAGKAPEQNLVPIESLDDAALADFIIKERPAAADRVYAIKVADAAALTTSEASPQLSPAFQESAAGPVPTLRVVPPELEGITPAQMEAWHAVNAARSKVYRANLTSEQAAHQSKEGTRRSAASRERMSPEQQAARSAREAERLRQKRALTKNPQP